MKKFTIGVERFPEKLCECLNEARDKLQETGVSLQGERFTRGKYTFFTYRLCKTIEGQADELTQPAIQALAEGVAEFITDVWERSELARIVANDFYYYCADEVEYLSSSAVQMLAELKDQDGYPLRRRHIVESVVEQLRQSPEVLIEGMLRFRMNALQADLHRVIEQAIDEYLMDLEYQEFVKLLRYFVAAQDPGMPLLHMVCHEENGSPRLFDGEGRPLMLDELEGAKQQANLRECGVMIEETMSALISAAPQRVHIHLALGNDNPPPIVETVKKVFADAAVICNDCPLCETARSWQAPSNAADRKM
ncbi:putative sporulation protein YtxC [Tumebacillus permanentifrigoris]|uniref:Putative sporulation protein YtxC n=1 Tax=Tumebacillus permanentifrigoris TaxID=378543 RepID=A0A316DWL8_9BACL|nr:putative sporulation protein YtxC [Tumebacillus permanentifrigoris]PWK13964.1 putative sporulation protein YtxC [Tumebacillus permanentifrigoris]